MPVNQRYSLELCACGYHEGYLPTLSLIVGLYYTTRKTHALLLTACILDLLAHLYNGLQRYSGC